MKVYDCFIFFNELDLLEIRLNTLDEFVDYFVLVESTITHSGKDKPLYYRDNKDRFSKFSNKIIHIVVEDTPNGNSFERDVFQKNCMIRGLKNCDDDDLVITSDLDEIPNPRALSEVIKNCQHDKVYHFAQDLFYYFLNLKEISGNLLSYTGEFQGVSEKKWLGSKLCKFKFLKDKPVSILRHPEMKNVGVRVPQGGWHFTYLGGEEKIKTKLESFSHQEFNNDQIKSRILENVKSNRDIFYRPSNFVKVNLDDSFPRYILENKQKYQNLINDS